MTLPITTSLLCSVDKNYRLLRKIEAQLSMLTFQLSKANSYSDYIPSQLKPVTNRIHLLKSYRHILLSSSAKQLDKHSLCKKRATRLLNQRLTNRQIWEKLSKLSYFKSSPKYTDLEIAYLEELKDSSISARKFEKMTKLRHELLHAHNNDGCIIFNTLTVNNENYDAMWEKGSKYFINYIKKFEEHCDDHRYFAIHEEGSKTGRSHVHVVHILYGVRKGSITDPNSARLIPNLRQLEFCRGFWELGFSSPIAVRFSQADFYGKLGFQWPVKSDINNSFHQPIKQGSPDRLASYLSKYLNKIDLIKGVNKWRTRMTRNFGMIIYDQLNKILNWKELIIMLELSQRKTLQIQGSPINERLMLMSTLKEMMRRSNWTQEYILTIYRTLKPRQSALKRLRNLILRLPNPNCLSIGDIPTKTMKKTVISKFDEYYLEKKATQFQKLINDLTVESFGFINEPRDFGIRGSSLYAGDLC